MQCVYGGVCTGSGHSKHLILNGIAAYFAFKSGLYRSFRGQKERYRKNSESYNALFDAKKGDIGPENAYFWACITHFSICYRGPTRTRTPYPTVYSVAISVSADAASIYAVAATAASGGTATPATGTIAVTATVISIANGMASFLVCGPAPSQVTSTIGTAVPGWRGAVVSAIDAGLAIAGH